MKKNLYNLVRDQFGSSARDHLGGLLGRKPNGLTSGIDDSIKAVLDSFSSVAEDAAGREVLYEAVRYCDDEVVENPAKLFKKSQSEEVFIEGHNRLAGLVGIAKRDKMVAELESSSNLSHADAENTLSYVTPGVLGVLKRQIEQGAVLDNPDGIGQMFLGEGDAKSVPAATQVIGGASATSGGGAAAAVSGESDMSWLFRYVLPIVLLGGLVLAGMKNCGNMADKKLVAEQETKMQLEIDSSKARVDGLTQELDVAKANIVTLEGDIRTARAELQEAKDLPTETAELQGLLSSAISDRDTSVETSVQLQAKLDAVLAERQTALDESLRLQGELDVALAEVKANEEAMLSVDSIKAELEEISAGRDEAVARNVEFKTANTELQLELDGTAPKIAELERQLAIAASLRTELEDKISSTTLALDEERAKRVGDVNRLSAKSTDLQGQLGVMLGMRDEAMTTLSLRDGEVSSLGDRVVTLEGELATLQDANAKAREEAAQLEAKIAALNGELDTTKVSVDEARGALASTEETLSSVNVDLETARAQVEVVSTERDELLNKKNALAARIEELMAEKDAAIGETVKLNEQIAALTTDLDAARTSNAASEDKLGLLNGSFSNLKTELGLVTGARDEASSQASKLRIEVSDLRKEVARIGDDLTTAQAAHDKAMAAMQAERDSAQGALDSVQRTLKSEISTLEDQRNAALAKIEEADAQLAALNIEKQQAQATIDEMNARTETLQIALQKEEGSVSDLQVAIAALESTKMSLTTERDGSNKQVSKLSEEIAAMQDSLQNEQAMVGELNAEITDLKASISKLTEEREEANDVIELLDSKVMENGKEIGSLVDSNAALQRQIDAAAAAVQAEIDSTLVVRSSIEERLNAAGLTTATVDAIEDNRAVAIVLGTGDLYGVGSASLSPQGNAILGTVGSIVAEYPEWRVDVEGHTDSQGIGAALRQKYPTNWELSSARASAAVRYLNSRAGIDAEKLSARGLGQTRPLESNETAKGRELNRRVEVILRR